MGKTFKVSKGIPYPLGATVQKGGVNFSVFSENGIGVELLLFERHDSLEPFLVIKFDPNVNKTFNIWHVFVADINSEFFYGYRIDGKFDPENGHRFNHKKVLIDPYSKGIDYALWKKEDAINDGDNLRTSLRSAIIDTSNYNWEGDTLLKKPLTKTVIYELHVGNFTKSPTSGCKFAGKFKGLIEKIPYLKSLGVTAIELLPVFDFKSGDPKNVWGYGTTGFFAPESSYCIASSEASHVKEFRDMVKALHKSGLEVILDVAVGYTTESDGSGTTISFKGFDNSVYYLLDPNNKENYLNYSGCKNTLNCNHPVVAKFILDCLEYWTKEMHVDGFRIDEASLLSRDNKGNVEPGSHILWNIDLSEILSESKIFVEPWDASGGYTVGAYPSQRFVEWNDKFRDDTRKFVRGDSGIISSIASRLTGSKDLYLPEIKQHQRFVNYITVHDGFTLCDLVSYNQKHNEANGEDNRDGMDQNYSWNCGAEGEVNIDFVQALRKKQMKNFLTLLLIAQGIPIISMGDEIARTQKGNNNAYCQDSELTWFDWSSIEKNKEILEFFRNLIGLRKYYSFFNDIESKSIKFHGCKLNCPGWNDVASRVLSSTIDREIQVIINMEDKALEFELLPVEKSWYECINTAAKEVGACLPGREKSLGDRLKLTVESRSVVVLIAK